MAKRHKIFPPLEETRSVRIRRAIIRFTVNLFVLIAACVIYYVVFSALFDTRREYELRKSTEKLRTEYEALTDRMTLLEDALQSVTERDRNVFGMLFEAEPYYLYEEDSRWSDMERLREMSNSELGKDFLERLDNIETAISASETRLNAILTACRNMGDTLNRIPAIQPVINNDLTSLTASFGERIHPFYKTLTQHDGVDFTLPEESRVFATADGIVADASQRASTSGLSVVIDHGNGYETHYNHLSKLLVKKGQSVRRGDIIALSGNTGLSLAPHLHYEVRYNGTAIDPINYFFMELSPDEYAQIIRIAQRGMQSFD